MSIVLSSKTKLITRMIFLLLMCIEYSSQMNMKNNSQIGLSKINENLIQMKDKFNSYYNDKMQTNNLTKLLLYISIFISFLIGLVLYCVYKSKHYKEEKENYVHIQNEPKAKIIKRKKKGVNISNYISFYKSLSNPSSEEFTTLLNSP